MISTAASPLMRGPLTMNALSVFSAGLLSVLMVGCAGMPSRAVPSKALAKKSTVSESATQIDSPKPSPVPEKRNLTFDPRSLYAEANTASATATSAGNSVDHSTQQASNPSIQQVGFKHLREKLGTGRCPSCEGGAGCVACGPANSSCADACQQAPHGYALQASPRPWYYDPQEFLCDGGDHSPNATLNRNDAILGLQPEDTVTHYTTEAGEIEFTASNRVCLYAPRFGSIRRITGALADRGAIATIGVDRPVGPRGVDLDLPGWVVADTTEIAHAEMTRRIDSMRDRNRGVRIENIQQLEVSQDVLAILASIRNLGLSELDEAQLAIVERHANAAVAWTIDESVEIEIQDLAPPTLTRDQKVDALVVYEFPDAGRLNLIKLADKQHAGIGEKVKFALRLQNVGDSPVSGVVVTDNLTTRLEYVAESQSASMKAEFLTSPNDAGSSRLTWRLSEELGVGETVTIEFECLVR